MDNIKNIVKSVIGNISSRNAQDQYNIQECWERVLTHKELPHTKIHQLHNEQLIVHVDSSAWLYQFNLKKEKILKKLQHDNPDVKKIYFKIGKVK